MRAGTVRGLAIVAAIVGASGCASIVHGTTQTVRVETVPAGAALVVLPEGRRLVSPAEVELKRKQVHTVLATLEGYEPARGYLDRSTSGVVYGNLIFGGTIGMNLDSANGAAFRLDPDPLRIQMVPIEKPDVAALGPADSAPTESTPIVAADTGSSDPSSAPE